MSSESDAAGMARTVSVLITAALAEEDVTWVRGYLERRYEFRLLAAADREIPGLPQEGWYDVRHLLKVASVSENGELRVTVQAEGFAALSRVAIRQARLRSQDGVVDLRIGFDTAGHALVVLADTPQVRSALTQFYLVLEEPESTPDGAPALAGPPF